MVTGLDVSTRHLTRLVDTSRAQTYTALAGGFEIGVGTASPEATGHSAACASVVS